MPVKNDIAAKAMGRISATAITTQIIFFCLSEKFIINQSFLSFFESRNFLKKSVSIFEHSFSRMPPATLTL